MHLLNETTVNTIMDACWTAYRAAKRGIDILESIGLSVEGAAKDKAHDMSVLFEAQTAAENAMFAIAGLQRAANAADKASAILAKEAGANDPPSIIFPGFSGGRRSGWTADRRRTRALL